MADADVLVVGSGFGGAFAAARLTAAGVRVIVIERGPWRDTVPVRSLGIEEPAPLPCGRRFASHMFRTLRSPWLPVGVTLNRKGLFELYVGKGLNVACTSSVGGGSHAYGGLNMRPPVDGYWNRHTDDICEKTMEPHYQSVFESMGSRAPRPGDQVPNTTAQRFGDSPVLQSGWDTVDVPMGFLFPRVAGSPQSLVTADGVTRHEADMRDGGFLGSTTGAKTTLDFAVLAAAMRKGLAVEALCEVTAIERLARDRRVATASKRSIIGSADAKTSSPTTYCSQPARSLASTPAPQPRRRQAHRYATARLSLRRQRRFPGLLESRRQNTRPDPRPAGSRPSPDEGTGYRSAPGGPGR